jgi:hypothetical protein
MRIALNLTMLAVPMLAHAHTYVLSYYNPNAAYPICSSTLTRSCGTGITIWELVNGQWVLVVKQNFRATSYTMYTVPTAGNHTYGLWAAYKDANGVRQHTSLYQKTLTVPNVGQ